MSDMPEEDMSENHDFENSFEQQDKEYKIEVDWTKFSESQIQLLMALLFESMNHNVENWHESDRSHEDGADLVVKDLDMAIAVKIKPKSADRPQLLDLSKRPEKEKVYIYIQTPSAKFREYMTEFEDKIDFWNSTKLNKYLIKHDLGFATNLIFDNHPISKSIHEARIKLCGIHDECLAQGKKSTKPLDSKSLKWLFRLKDDSVALHKTNKNVITLFDKPIHIKSKELNEHFLVMFLKYLDINNSRLSSYIRYFSQFYESNKALVDNSIIDNIGKSTWSEILQYNTDYSATSLQDELKTSQALNKFTQKVDEEQKRIWKEQSKNNDVWSVIESRIRNLTIFGDALEEIIDDIVDEYANNMSVSD